MSMEAATVGCSTCILVVAGGAGRCRAGDSSSVARVSGIRQNCSSTHGSLQLQLQLGVPTSDPFYRRGFLGLLSASSLSLPLSLSLAAGVQEQEALAVPSRSPSCDFTIAPSGLGFCDTSPGSGLPASQGTLIKANYIGKLEDGKVFDSSYDRGKPLTFKIGVGQVIKGWDEGILGGKGIPPMLTGGKRKLRIPPQLGYGERGAGCRAGSCAIPPNSVLLFDVEFVGKAY